MAKRHRRRDGGANERQEPKTQVSGNLIAVSPKKVRVGLDGSVIFTLAAIEEFLRALHSGIQNTAEVTDGDSAVKQYLAFLSVLVFVTLGDIGMSAIHEHDIMVLMKLRLILEYAIKGAYCNDNPEYALYMMTISAAEQFMSRMKRGGMDPATIARAEEDHARLLARFSSVSKLKKLKFDEIMAPYADKESYVWYYGIPSALLHGDPEGLRSLLEVDQKGDWQAQTVFSVDRVNAMLVDAGRYALMFCDVVMSRCWASDQAKQERRRELNRSLLALILKHPDGRDQSSLAEVEAELGIT